ncbi:unnamed protein product [Ambrosiozyma monospora]|uniref:Unnamed protein product n=1 Tax=Ambrosiozyma monospora TaxID=43982 RepID=A0ACB5T4L6_AMBMO|nr:unnamed protein product [Ambrosiozyma monospora]
MKEFHLEHAGEPPTNYKGFKIRLLRLMIAESPSLENDEYRAATTLCTQAINYKKPNGKSTPIATRMNLNSFYNSSKKDIHYITPT